MTPTQIGWSNVVNHHTWPEPQTVSQTATSTNIFEWGKLSLSPKFFHFHLAVTDMLNTDFFLPQHIHCQATNNFRIRYETQETFLKKIQKKVRHSFPLHGFSSTNSPTSLYGPTLYTGIKEGINHEITESVGLEKTFKIIMSSHQASSTTRPCPRVHVSAGGGIVALRSEWTHFYNPNRASHALETSEIHSAISSV